jgi:hypothetical protein
MEIFNKISVVKNASYCSVGSHFLAAQFSKELVMLKVTREYKEVVAKYSMQAINR